MSPLFANFRKITHIALAPFPISSTLSCPFSYLHLTLRHGLFPWSFQYDESSAHGYLFRETQRHRLTISPHNNFGPQTTFSAPNQNFGPQFQHPLLSQPQDSESGNTTFPTGFVINSENRTIPTAPPKTPERSKWKKDQAATGA